MALEARARWRAASATFPFAFYMNHTGHEEKGPNIAGVTLALYLLACLLSMMAAYEVGKKLDDGRAGFSISVHSVVFTVHKNNEDRRDDSIALPPLHSERADLDAPLRQISNYELRYARKLYAFSARGPPRASDFPV